MDPQALINLFRRTVTEHYFDMKGRVSRSEFWYFVLCCIVLGIIAALISVAIFVPLNAVLGLALLPPMAGMGARRLQDVGQNGQIIWVLLLPSLLIQLFGLLVWGPFGALGFLAFYFTIGWLLKSGGAGRRRRGDLFLGKARRSGLQRLWPPAPGVRSVQARFAARVAAANETIRWSEARPACRSNRSGGPI